MAVRCRALVCHFVMFACLHVCYVCMFGGSLARVHQIIEIADPLAGRLFTKAWDQRMDNGGPGREQQLARNPERKSHMLKIGFTDRPWVRKEQSFNRIFHRSGHVLPQADHLWS